MSEFKTIETQEQLDKIISERLNREKEKYESKLSEYESLKGEKEKLEKQLSELSTSLEETNANKKNFEEQINELNKKVKTYETKNLKTKIALENGIPYEFANRISGEDEKSIKEDAQKIAEFFKSQQPTPPLKDTEPPKVDGENAEYKNLLSELNLKGE